MSLDGRKKVKEFLLQKAAREVLLRKADSKGLFDFGKFHDCYREEVQDSIAFTGQSHDFFTRVKVDYLMGAVAQYLGDPGRLKVLDVGCGVGLTDQFLVDRVKEIHGIDISGPVVRQARKKNPRGKYKVYNGAKMPFRDGTFDVTFAICVLHHVPPTAYNQFMKEMARVTKPGGLVAIFEHNPLNPLTLRAVNSCVLDDEAILLRRWKVGRLLERRCAEILEKRYILFTPFNFAPFRALDRLLGWLPLGAQYVVVARR